MIPDFKTFISESIWADIHRRSNGTQTKKEDKTNIDELKPVDIGTSVLWADRDLEKYGEYLFAFDEIPPINSNEWRLPTIDEINELENALFGEKEKIYISKNAYTLRYRESNIKVKLIDGSLIYKNGDVELEFKARGGVFPGNTRVDYVGEFYDGWGDDNTKDFDDDDDCANHYHFGPRSFKASECLKNGKNCVRLVKNK